jgi:hypothetical protein
VNSIEYSRISHAERVRMATNHVLDLDPAVRPRDLNGTPGGLIEYADDDGREFILVGDLHAVQRNLACVLLDSGNIGKLRRNEAVLVLIGDVVHSENPGEFAEMDSSIAILDVVVHLINRYPNNVIYLLGNHDSFDPNLTKSGILQGKLFRDRALALRGEEYVEAVVSLFDALPLCVKHPGFLAVHAGPVRDGISRDELINAYHSPNFVWQLTWNRLNETRSNPSMKEYGNDDIVAMRELMRCHRTIPFVVGHNPMWKWGGDDSVWINPAGTKDHVIIYGNSPKKCPYLSVLGSRSYEIKYANMRLKKRKFILDDYA